MVAYLVYHPLKIVVINANPLIFIYSDCLSGIHHGINMCIDDFYELDFVQLGKRFESKN